MSRRTDARGATFQAALTSAVAELLDREPDEVELELRAPGIDDLQGSIRLDLEVEGDDEGDDLGDLAEETAAETTPAGGRAVEDTSDRDEGPDEDTSAHDEGPDEDVAEEREPIRPEDLDEEADVAADFLEGLLDAMDLPGDLRIRINEDHAEVEVVEIGSGALIGRRGQTLEAIQELVRCALQREFQRRSRVKIDAEGYRSRRLEKLLEKAEEAIDVVLDGGEPERLEPMDVFERKAIHQLVASYEGVSSRSQGREPARRVIIERD
jgi:spoIIIJ-associated protein